MFEGKLPTLAVNRGERFQASVKYLVVGYPVVFLGLFFCSSLVLVFVFSFYSNISGGYYEPAFTFENYVRFFTNELYFNRFVYTIKLAMLVTVATVLVSYPLGYHIGRAQSELYRRVMLLTIMSSLWITYIIRAYAWTVILSRNGVVNQVLVALGVFESAQSLSPSYWGLVVGLVYIMVPFMVLTIYNSVTKIDDQLILASKNLGAGPLQTFRKVTLPLSANGVFSGSLLVFILTVGTYILPKVLGKPNDWPIAVIIGDQITQQSNVPFGAAISVVVAVTVLLILFVAMQVSNVDSIGDANV